jgi:hypothetical protein
MGNRKRLAGNCGAFLYRNSTNQNDHLPKELLSIAGKLSLGIEMAIYSLDAFEKDED